THVSLKVKDSQIQASSYKRMGLGPHREKKHCYIVCFLQSGVEDGVIYDGAWCPAVAQYMRINPQTSFKNGTICLRAEIMGCELPGMPNTNLSFISHMEDLSLTSCRSQLMKSVNEMCPDITRIYSIGKSYMGLKLYVIEISDNPGKHELGEPEFRYVAGMHGNEVLGRELLLNLMEYICQEYKCGNQCIVHLVKETSIHLLPSMNPDGYEMAYKKVEWGKASRVVNEGIDMNHNFADLNTVMWDAIKLEIDKSKLINHYFPIPEHYTSEDAMVK
uniref:Peptidase M14 domain-containing protein n=1 Tax=Sinocyclocheilus grahami TaxID=75366 RepID=A0A672KKJ2_SINGR